MAESERPLVMLTGGFTKAEQMATALGAGHADVLGVGRMSVLYPDLPRRILGEELERLPRLWSPRWFPKLVGAGVNTAWYVVQMGLLGAKRELNRGLGGMEGVVRMWV